MIPNNSTPVPNVIFDFYLQGLGLVELKVLLVIIRKTLGWVNGIKGGGRKRIDWISHSQLVKLTGISRRSLSTAINSLVTLRLVNVYTSDFRLLTHADFRKGKTRLYYEFKAGDNKGINSTLEGISRPPWENIAEGLGKQLRITEQLLPITKETNKRNHYKFIHQPNATEFNDHSEKKK